LGKLGELKPETHPLNTSMITARWRT